MYNRIIWPLLVFSFFSMLMLSLPARGVSQNIEEIFLTSSQSWTWETPVTNTGAAIIVHPDASIGTAQVDIVSGKLVFDFIPTGLTGETEVTIEYWIDIPTHPTTRIFRFIVGASHVLPEKDYFSVTLNSQSNILDVLANDYLSEEEGVIQYIPIVNHGSATIDSGGTRVVFTPETGYAGMAYLSYVVCDSLGACGKADVTICVLDNPVNLTDTIYISTRSTEPVVAFLPTDGFAITNPPSSGNVVPVSGDAWEYTSDPFFAGVDTFILAKDSLVRYVFVNVYYKGKSNTHAIPDVVYTYPNTGTSFDVLANDIKDYPVDAFTLPAEGTLTHDSAGIFTYLPATDFEGAVTFEYTTCFTVHCETAEVTIFVGDLAPDNTKTYKLSTPKNTSLVINYNVPLKDFVFVIQADPQDGDLTFFPGYSNLTINCDTVSGDNLLVYSPDNDFTGDDAFELYYTIDGGDPQLIKIDVSVQDYGMGYNCHCVDGCVWPGDFNGNGQVDMLDLLTLGWHIGDVGDDRYYPDNTLWLGQYAEDWDDTQPVSGMNVKYVDGDGNGVISQNDMGLIEAHYLKRHNLVPAVSSIKSDYQFEITPLFTELDSGDLAVFEIAIGTHTNPALDLHGLNFSLNLPTELVDSASVLVDFHDNCWLAQNAPYAELQVQPWDGRVDAGFTRIGGIPVTGQGVISTLSFIVEDDVVGIRPASSKLPLRVQLTNAYGYDHAGRYVSLPDTDAEIRVNLASAQSNPSTLDKRLILYPNPAQEQINVHLNGKTELQTVEIFSITGQRLAVQQVDDKHTAFELAGFEQGIYILQAFTEEGVVTKTFEVIR